MRSVELLQSTLKKYLSRMHPRREAAVWRAVTGLILGGKACLTALGRSLPGSTSDKHRIKAVDRLLGNTALHRELDQIYRAVAHLLLKGVRTPVIAVDWTGAGAHHYELSAKLCCDGRALPLYSLVFAKQSFSYSIAHREFLHNLAGILPVGCKPILVTDAGFQLAWFGEVRRHSWHYIGRVRGHRYVWLDGQKLTLQQLHRRAAAHPRDLGIARLSLSDHHGRRLVLSPQRHGKGRQRLTRKGKPGRNTTDRKTSQGAREPWVLATSLQADAAFIVHAYSLRMQIEQAFRDRKCYRHGWNMRLTVTRSRERLAVLLMVASLAELAVQLVGRAMANTPQGYSFQANTTRKQRVLSYFFLGCHACRRGLEHTALELRAAFTALVQTIETHGKHFVAELIRSPRLPNALRGRASVKT